MMGRGGTSLHFSVPWGHASTLLYILSCGPIVLISLGCFESSTESSRDMEETSLSDKVI